MLHFNIVYFSFFVDIKIVHSSFIYNLFIRLDLILNNANFLIIINFITIVTHKFFEYDILFKFNWRKDCFDDWNNSCYYNNWKRFFDFVYNSSKDCFEYFKLIIYSLIIIQFE